MNPAPIPRRARIDQMTDAERAIREAIGAVELLPADVRLTDAVVLLGAAKESVADFVDGIYVRRFVQDQVPSQAVPAWRPIEEKEGNQTRSDQPQQGISAPDPRGVESDDSMHCKAPGCEMTPEYCAFHRSIHTNEIERLKAEVAELQGYLDRNGL